jgi:2-oxoglutarate dehydrogenase E1 component
LYPLPTDQLKNILAKYKNAKEFYWVQEEPENMGAWSYILRCFREVHIQYIGRTEAASPATGYSKLHAAQQQAILDKVFQQVKVSVN